MYFIFFGIFCREIADDDDTDRMGEDDELINDGEAVSEDLDEAKEPE